ncbi:FAD-dependent oxidoreductase [Brasilonema octagenarum UFV-E1]|uniref:FAD-dependent oxidoreductase n=1 Tax=Brasilonema sennae CENA114 TaxID=415709 RepID=A0A856MH86_9CYAN|nr:NAD(P)/FAD-dependent oxidoreductase [Brasilonema sennae]QDL10593.1 FAD-dependent oxidoreductase [Brasilonema sennae CENA114]QDL16936.1 FAD-dependent oxidoreductase [Brasilonema octagenarum UFV-E1]
MARTPQFRQLLRILQLSQRKNLKAEGKPLSLAKKQAQWSRRRFIKLASLATGSALVTSGLSHPEKVWGRASHSGNPKIAIVGGGIAGLNAAYQLKKIGLTATVYEARERLGGRIQTVTGVVGEGLVTDLGGQFINTNHTDMLALAKEFDIKLFSVIEEQQKLPFPGTAYYFDGKVQSEAEIADKLRPLALAIYYDAELLEQNFEQYAPIFDSMSAADYLNKYADKIPEPFIRRLIENTIRSEYGVEPEESSAIQLLMNLPTVDGNKVELLGNSDEAFVVEGGSGRIIDSLAQALSGQIHTRMPLTRIQSNGSGFLLTFSRNYVVDADYVIIAIPLTVLREVDIQVNLPNTLRRFIKEVDLGFNQKVIAGFNKKAWRQENGFVKEVWSDLKFCLAWDGTLRQPDRENGELVFFLGGDEVRRNGSGSGKLQGRKFVRQLDDFIVGAKDAATDKFLQTQWTRDPFTKGSYTQFKPGQLTEFAKFLYVEADDPKERQDVNVGNLVFAGEHLSDEFYGYMNGAAQTGRLAAQVVARQHQAQVMP